MNYIMKKIILKKISLLTIMAEFIEGLICCYMFLKRYEYKVEKGVKYLRKIRKNFPLKKINKICFILIMSLKGNRQAHWKSFHVNVSNVTDMS